MMVLLSFLIAAILGFFFISLLWPNESEFLSEIPIRFCLGLGVGSGLTSCLLFLWLVFYGQADRKYLLLEGVVTAALAVSYILKRRRSPRSVSTSVNHSNGKYQWLLVAVLVLAVCAGIYAAIHAIIQQPHGNGWDAWAIYGVRARAIFRGGAGWRDTFSTLIPWSHPDYPLLLPLSTVRIWLYAGGEVKAVQSILTVTYALATVGVVTFGLKRLRGFEQGLIAGILVLSLSTLLTYAGSAYADVPVTFFFTATLVLFALHHATTDANYLVLAGVTAGLAAWTKNEGLLFVAACAAAHLLVVLRTQGVKAYVRQLRFFAYGLVPLLAIGLYFKTQLAPPSELVTAMSNQSTAAKLLDFRRYIFIARSFYWELIYYTGRGINLTYLLPLYLLCVGVTLKHKLTILQVGLTLLLMFAGYFWVYLTTPYDVAFHIKFSIDRLMMQQWPSFVFLFFLIAMSPNESFHNQRN
jgi:hypothetical protein